MLDIPDPLCLAASLFDMATFTIIALTENQLFRALLDRFAQFLYKRTEIIAQALPDRLWRIYGPEYASEPYLPPRLFKEYVVDYDKPMIEAIQKNGGFVTCTQFLVQSLCEFNAACGFAVLLEVSRRLAGSDTAFGKFSRG
jgi:hypothetical protein